MMRTATCLGGRTVTLRYDDMLEFRPFESIFVLFYFCYSISALSETRIFPTPNSFLGFRILFEVIK